MINFVLVARNAPVKFSKGVRVAALRKIARRISRKPTTTVVPVGRLNAGKNKCCKIGSSRPLRGPACLSGVIRYYSVLVLPVTVMFTFNFCIGHEELKCDVCYIVLTTFLVKMYIGIPTRVGKGPHVSTVNVTRSGKTVRNGRMHLKTKTANL